MSTKIFSAAVIGLEAEPVEVEADTGLGPLGTMAVVGLPDAAVQESRERVRLAISNSDFPLTKRRIVANLAPADLRKVGPAYDLPIALSILMIKKQVNQDFNYSECIFVGELALDGALRPINGVLSVAMMARDRNFKKLFLPEGNAVEASLIPEIEVHPIKSLRQMTDYLDGKIEIKPLDNERRDKLVGQQAAYEHDFAYIKGQEHVKRALEIAVAGGHNILMSGPPGSGKTLLAKSLPSILPEMNLDEILEVTKIYSVAGLLSPDEPLIVRRPFRAPHHTASGVALVGGGSWPKPGEISLAHRGILFLDEFPEFERKVLENLRQPLEDGVITVSRASHTLKFPAQFMLIASMNPCPCGYLTDNERECTCSPTQIIQYQKKISGPLLDRIDLHLEVPRVKFDKLRSEEAGEKSAAIRKRVEETRRIQALRFREQKNLTNTEMNTQQIKNYCQVDRQTTELLKKAVEQLPLSARAYYRVLKVGRTIADLAGMADIKLEHVAEALQYRPRGDL